jgi:hypothetical protein
VKAAVIPAEKEHVCNSCSELEEVVTAMSVKGLRESPEVRGATLKLLTISDRALSLAQVANERAITHLRVRVRAWQLALDPHTKAWISTAKASLADGTARAEAMGSEEIAQRLDDARRDLPA